MPTRAELQVMKEAFYEVFDAIGSLRPAAREAGIDPTTAWRWIKESGRTAHRLDDPRKATFLTLRAEGVSRSQAAGQVGIVYSTAYRWDKGIRRLGAGILYPDGRFTPRTGKSQSREKIPFVQKPTSGVLPLPESVNPRYLSYSEREWIADLYRAGWSFRAIGRDLKRSASTIQREINRHSIDGEYHPYHAHHHAARNRARPKVMKLATNTRLRDVVEDGLARRRSPEQICHRLVVDYPDDESMRVSHETIYQSIYVQARGSLKRDVQQRLRTGRVKRKLQKRQDQRTPRFKDDMIMISERPPEIEDRAIPGHWEGDLITGAQNRTAIGTLVERNTRFTMLLHLPDGHTALHVRDAIVEKVKTLPESVRGSLTWDQGAEMAEHVSVKMLTGMDVYFCDPHSPWQRGTNENTNGLLRQYFPKGTDLSVYGPADLEYVENELNDRPRKTLEWRTPAERMREVLEA